MTVKAKQTAAVISFVAGLATVLYWIMSGASLWTLTKERVEVKDELFGTTNVEWHDTFKPGLEYIGPIVVVLLLLSIFFYMSSRRSKAKQ